MSGCTTRSSSRPTAPIPKSSSVRRAPSRSAAAATPGNFFDDKGLANISHAYIAETDVNDNGTGWAVTAVNTFTAQAEFSIDVICAAV